MLKEGASVYKMAPSVVVLILILMEHAQRDTLYKQGENAWEEVLILILMEHAQREDWY